MKIYTVTEINNYIKLLINKDNVLSYVKISGEVSNCKYHSSGHIYFTIKDSTGQLSCVMFAGKRTTGLKFQLAEGQSVVVTGEISVYERDGKYQLYASQIEKQGLGELYERFEKLKQQLQYEGLFDTTHKKPIPKYIKTLGVITASTGAAIQDIINITTRRNPYVKIILYPAKVQGQDAAKTLIAGIKKMEEISPDVIIIGRGGGSIEDLFEFNDEALARTIYSCPIPVISAVGHETDFTICDFVSDLRAPTPSAAAELAVYNYRDFEKALIDYHYDLLHTMEQKINLTRGKNEQYRLRLMKLSPNSRLNNYRLYSDKLRTTLENLMHNRLTAAKHRMAVDAQALNRQSPLNSLTRGYSYISDAQGHNVKSIKDLNLKDTINVKVTDGSFKATITEINS